MKTLFTSIALALSLASLANAHSSAQAGISQPIKSTISQIKTLDDLNLHLQKDLPNSKPKAVVVISHGLASHSGVFGDFAKTMNQNGIAVYRFDHCGHGKSDGRDSIHIKSYFEMVEDLRLVVEKAKKKIQTRLCLCWGIQWADTLPHSTAPNTHKGRTALFWRQVCFAITK